MTSVPDERITTNNNPPENSFALGWMASAVFCESLQWLIILSVISHHVPIDTSYFMARSFEKGKVGFFLTRQILLYRVFGLMTVALAYVGWRLWRHRLSDGNFVDGVKRYAAANLFFLAWQVTGVFQIVTKQSAPWAWLVLYTGMGAAILLRLFWKEILEFWRKEKTWQFLSKNWFIIDVALLAILWFALMSLTGSQAMIAAKVFMSTAALYAGLRVWGIQPIIAGVGVYLSVKWIFLYGQMPPEFYPDGLILMLMALFARQGQWRYMLAAGMIAGCMLARMPVHGLPQTIALSVFIVGALVFGKNKKL
jgi:hypothetical protein